MLTSKGFKRMRYADYLPIIEQQAMELFGEDANLSERTPLGKFIRLQAYQRAEDNEEAEALYHSRFVDTSEGIPLEQNVTRALISRKEWRKATGEVTFHLNRNVKVPIGSIVQTKYDVKFQTTEEVHAFDEGEYTVGIEALEYGALGNVEAGEISIIGNPMPGIHSVTNVLPLRDGQDEETDEELRKRYYESLGKLGNRRVESIKAKVLDEVDGVRSCVVIENDTIQEDADGRPPKSFETILLGGEPEEIAQKIFEAKPAGIQAYGSIVKDVNDSHGMVHKIGFTYAAVVPVHVKVYVKKTRDYPINGDDQIKEQVVKYIGGTYENGLHGGVGMSENVIVSRCESRMFVVDGVKDVRVELSTDGTAFKNENVLIAFPQVAETDTSKIEVLELV